ncbi:MAG: flagellar filament capping protein FliD [Oscillospiraceae bacterium]|nr:flagellar filament capping protein FliD [Oscillospiraceae bacterium]
MAISASTLRLTGLSSGMDTDAIIKSLMKIEQLKLDRQLHERTKLQWKQEALGQVKADLTAFKQDFLSVVGANSITKADAFNTYKVDVSGSGASAVTLSATMDASVGSITINEIKKLAKGASETSVDKVSNSAQGLSATNSTQLKDLDFKNKLEFVNGQISFKINDETFTFNETDTLARMISTVNSSTKANVTMTYSQLTDKFSIESKVAGAGSSLSVTNLVGNAFSDGGAFGMTAAKPVSSGAVADRSGTLLKTTDFGVKLGSFELKDGATLFEQGKDKLSFKINGREFEFDKDDTLQYMVGKVNNSGIGVEIKFDDATSKFTLEPTNGKPLSIENVSGNVFGEHSAIGITEIKSSYSAGQDAELIVNGITLSRSTNNFTIDGINYKLNKTTAAGADIDATVSRDVQPAVDKIKTFVDAYNKLVKNLDDKLTETKTKDETQYTPLTDDEKTELGLSEKQIEEWEAIAKKGLLRRDTGIQDMLNSLRTALYERVAGAGLSPADIGLKTGAYSLGMKGQIVLDEEKLRSAFEADPDRVMSVFTNVSDSSNAATKRLESGLAERIGSIVDKYTGGYQSTSLTTLTDSLKKLDDRISAIEEKMLAKEEQLYKKYAAMETALAALNSQSEWLAGVLGGQSA